MSSLCSPHGYKMDANICNMTSTTLAIFVHILVLVLARIMVVAHLSLMILASLLVLVVVLHRKQCMTEGVGGRQP